MTEPFQPSRRHASTDADLIAAQLERRVAARRLELVASMYVGAPRGPLHRRASNFGTAAAAIVGAASGAIACFLVMPVFAASVVVALAMTASGWVAVRRRTLTRVATGVAVGMLLGALVAWGS